MQKPGPHSTETARGRKDFINIMTQEFDMLIVTVLTRVIRLTGPIARYRALRRAIGG